MRLKQACRRFKSSLSSWTSFRNWSTSFETEFCSRADSPLTLLIARALLEVVSKAEGHRKAKPARRRSPAVQLLLLR